MASIQAAPNLPQVGVGGIPANLTPQRVQEIFQVSLVLLSQNLRPQTPCLRVEQPFLVNDAHKSTEVQADARCRRLA